MTNEVALIGNTEITEKVISIRSRRLSTVKDRLELGKLFSELRAAVDKYTRTSKDKNKVSYAEAVRLTGVPRGTAELYRQMYEVCKGNDIPADVFVILADAGFNLARDLNETTQPAAIFADNPNLTSEEYLLGLSEKDTGELIEKLRKDYGKEEVQAVSIETLKSDVARMKKAQSESKDADYKAFLQDQIDAKTKTFHNKMLSALRNVANAFATLLGKHEDFVDSYIEETKESGAMTEQRYQEAVAFAQKATFLDNSVPGKPAASVKSNGAKRTKAA